MFLGIFLRMSRPYRLDVRYREQLGALHTSTRREILGCLSILCNACTNDEFRITNERELNIAHKMMGILERVQRDPDEPLVEPTIRLRQEGSAPPVPAPQQAPVPVPVPPQTQAMPVQQFHPQYYPQDGNPMLTPPAWFTAWLQQQQGPPTPILRRTTTVGLWNSPTILRSPLRTP